MTRTKLGLIGVLLVVPIGTEASLSTLDLSRLSLDNLFLSSRGGASTHVNEQNLETKN